MKGKKMTRSVVDKLRRKDPSMARVVIKDGKVEGYLTVTECSKKLKVTSKKIRQWIHDGELPSIKLYNIYLIKNKDAKKPKVGK